jgi:hypothetical protein
LSGAAMAPLVAFDPDVDPDRIARVFAGLLRGPDWPPRRRLHRSNIVVSVEDVIRVPPPL